jgi:hypothetical protein
MPRMNIFNAVEQEAFESAPVLCSVRVWAELENCGGAVLAPTRQDITEVSLPE